MATSPFQRRMDKIAYVFGTTILIAYSYLIGSCPHTAIYTYSTMLMVFLLCHRYYSYWTNGYFYYLYDFCYVANFFMIYLLNFAPKNQSLLITCFVFSNGPLAAAIAAFRNSLVYHRVDMLTSLAIHAIPMTLMTHIRWVTVPEQSNLPLEDQYFAPFAEANTWGEWFEIFFYNPLQVYLIWLVVYGVLNFVVTSDVVSYKAESSYSTFT